MSDLDKKIDQAGRSKPGLCRAGGSRSLDKEGNLIKENKSAKPKTENKKDSKKN